MKFLDFLVPRLCPGCGKTLLPDGQEMCNDCLDACETLPDRRCPSCGGPGDGLLKECRLCQEQTESRPWRRAVSAYPFSGSIRHWIHEYKYRDKLYLAPFFAASLAEAWKQHGHQDQLDGIVPIPLHWLRFLLRGYNQSEVLAKMLGRHLGVPALNCLKRPHYTRPQAKMDKKQRARNIHGAFACRRSPAGLRLLLLDDVFTTGATLAAAARTLLDAGADSISVITVARDL